MIQAVIQGVQEGQKAVVGFTVTFPAGNEQLPPFEDYRMEGRTYRFLREKPLYPFGFGMTYSQTAISQLQVTGSVRKGLQVELEVKNTGSIEQAEVIQLYLKKAVKDYRAANSDLIAFRRVELAAGESRKLSFELGPETMQSVIEDGSRQIPEGKYTLIAGNASPGEHSEELGCLFLQQDLEY